MTFDTVEFGPNDIVMISHNIGSMPPSEVDAYVDKLLPKLTEIFGKEKVAFFPVREGETWEFTIIRKTV